MELLSSVSMPSRSVQIESLTSRLGRTAELLLNAPQARQPCLNLYEDRCGISRCCLHEHPCIDPPLDWTGSEALMCALNSVIPVSEGDSVCSAVGKVVSGCHYFVEEGFAAKCCCPEGPITLGICVPAIQGYSASINFAIVKRNLLLRCTCWKHAQVQSTIIQKIVLQAPTVWKVKLHAKMVSI